MQREIRITGDGYPTFFVPALNEHYHSIHGAAQESMHVFIQSGLLYQLAQGRKQIQLLEVGLGTGLNALLTLQAAEKYQIDTHYIALEPFPLSANEINKITEVPGAFSDEAGHALRLIHASVHNTPAPLTEHFTFTRVICPLEEYHAPHLFDLVYFDAFGPQAQPEIWSEANFKKLFDTMQPSGVLVTYSAKGAVRRAMEAAGFITQRIPGPPGKREMLRAIKK